MAALLATVAALWATDLGDRSAPLRIARQAAVGVAAAVAAVALLTLARAGSLPHFGLLARYGRIFTLGGYGNYPFTTLGFHVVVTLTFVGALATAAVRRSDRSAGRALTGMLAWAGLFGLGASSYFYAYRSHPDVMIDLFCAWSLALALLVVAVATASWRERRAPTLAALMVLFAFGLAAGSLAQLPAPGPQLRRIGLHGPEAEGPFQPRALARAIARATRPGERVAIIHTFGHRIAYEAGVVDVCPYTGVRQMPAREQLAETLSLLRREGGRRIFFLEGAPRPSFVRSYGLRRVRTWRGPVGAEFAIGA